VPSHSGRFLRYKISAIAPPRAYALTLVETARYSTRRQPALTEGSRTALAMAW